MTSLLSRFLMTAAVCAVAADGLAQSTFSPPNSLFVIGSNEDDEIAGLETNAAGETFVLGNLPTAAGFPATHVEPAGVGLGLPCFLTKLDSANTLVYSILFQGTDLCGTLTLSPSGTPYFTGYEAPTTSGLHVATVLKVDDSSGTPIVSRFAINNYNQLYSRVSELAVNANGDMFLIGACRTVEPSTPPIFLNGFNTQINAGNPLYPEVCVPGSPNQVVLTVVNANGFPVYGTYLTPDEGDPGIGRIYGLAADDLGRAYVMGYTSSLQPTAEAYMSSCSTLFNWNCSYLMTVDTANTGAASLTYASYLWDSQDVNRQIVRFGPGGSVILATDADTTTFPETHPTEPWYPRFVQPSENYSGLVKRGAKVARFNPGPSGAPTALAYGFITVGRMLTGLRVMPSGGAAVGLLQYDNQGIPSFWSGGVQSFYPSAETMWAAAFQPIPDNTGLWQPNFLIASKPGGEIVFATNTRQTPAPAPPVWDIAVDSLLNQDSGVNTPPVIQVSGVTSVLTNDPNGSIVSGFMAAYDAEDGAIGLNCSHYFNITVFPIGTTHVTCTAIDSGGLQASKGFDVTVQINATPVPSGDPAPIKPRDFFFGTPATLTFHGVQPPGGYVSINMNGGYPKALPAGVRPVYGWVYDLQTMAVFSTVDVCIDGPAAARQFTDLRLYELVNGTWLERPSTFSIPFFYNPTTAQVHICATVDQLGAFTIVEADDPIEEIVTVAGNAQSVFNGDGIPATSASVHAPAAVVGDAFGDLYISDSGHARVRKVSNGIITTFAGGGALPGSGMPATDVKLGGAAGLAIDREGGLLIMDSGYCVIRRVDPHGIITTVAGTVCGDPAAPDGSLASGSGLGFVSSASGLALDSFGNLVYSVGEQIRRIAAGADGLITGNDPAEILSTVAGDGIGGGYGGDGAKATTAQLFGAWHIAFDRFNNLFIADAANFRVRRVAAGHDGVVTGPPVPDDGSANDEIITTVVGTGYVNSPNSCSSDFDGGLGSQATLCTTQSIAFDVNGDLLVGENFLRRVTANASGQIVGGPGEIISRVGGTSRPGYAPNGDGSPLSVNILFTNMSVDPSGNILIADGINSLVRRYRQFHPGVTRPSVAIADASLSEGHNGTSTMNFAVTATGPMPYPVDVDFETADGTANSSDYSAAAGRKRLTAASRTATVAIAVNGDRSDEPDETFTVRLSSPTGGAVLGRAQATGTILNDEFDNRPPVAFPFAISPLHDRPFTMFPLKSDPDGDPVTVRVVVPPSHGTAVVQADQTIVYTPALHYVGPDELQYVASDGTLESDPALVSIFVTNAPPVVGNFNGQVTHDTPFTFFPIAVTNDADGDTLTIRIVTLPSHGTAIVQANRTILYTPTAHYAGPDPLEFAASDGVDERIGTIFITVTNQVPVATNINIALLHDTTVRLFPLAVISNQDFDPMTWRVVTPPAHGQLTIQADQSVIYTPFTRYAGPDAFTFVGNDTVVDSNVATAFITVTNNAPTAVSFTTQATDQPKPLLLTGNDADGDALTFVVKSQPTHGSLGAVNGQQIIYTAAAGYFGPDSFTYAGTDGIVESAPATVSIDVQPPTTALAVVVAAPNGGERVFINHPTPIRWSTRGAVASATVELSRNNGSSYTAIPGCTNLSALPTQCVWIPTGPQSASARIRVTVRDAANATATDVSDAVFSILAGSPSITVLQPDSRDWTEGTTKTITWNHNLGTQSFVRIELSRNNGATWIPIAVSLKNPNVTTGSYMWVVAGPPGLGALVRVTWLEDTSVFSLSPPFAIVPPVVTITQPNQLLQWRAGTTQTIRFTHSVGVAQPFAIDISRDSGATWSPIGTTTSTSPTQGSFSWPVTGPPTTTARVRVRWTNPPTALDAGDADFTILPRVTVTSPNTAVTWAAGALRTVSWTNHSVGSPTVDIHVSIDNGLTWAPHQLGVPSGASSGSYLVRMPNITTTQALVRVAPTAFPGDGDVSNVPFTLEQPRVTVAVPNTPMNWTIGTTRTISWTHNLGGSETARIELSRNGGGTWETLAASAPMSVSGTGAFQWTVVGPATTTALVRVSWNGNTSISDASDTAFNLVSGITVTSPNSAVTWAAGSLRTVTWNHNLGFGQRMDIDISLDGGGTWTPLAAGVASAGGNTGAAVVRMPSTPSSTGRVRVSPSGRPGDGDVSNTTFNLPPASITVASPNANVAWAIGSVHAINWNHNLGNFETASIELSRDGGATWSVLNAAAPLANTSGTFSWTVSGPPTAVALIRVAWAANSAVTDTGNTTFRIQ